MSKKSKKIDQQINSINQINLLHNYYLKVLEGSTVSMIK